MGSHMLDQVTFTCRPVTTLITHVGFLTSVMCSMELPQDEIENLSKLSELWKGVLKAVKYFSILYIDLKATESKILPFCNLSVHVNSE